MKTPEDVKKWLEKPDKFAFNSMKKLAVLDYIQQLEAQVPKWISVEDHTPMNEDEVLILINGKNINIGWFNERCGVWHVSSNCILVEVTHWMPLPESPKEG